MKFHTLFFVALCSYTRVNGFPQLKGGPHNWHVSEPDCHEFQSPGPYDSRSPCVGLNTLANHGWLPRDGQNIAYEDINQATQDAYNFAPDVFESAFQQVVDFGLSTTGSASTFNLRDLARHDTIEFDGSLTRNDIWFGDDLHFDATVFDIVAQTLGLYDDSQDQYVRVESAAKARAERVAEAMSANASFNASEAEMEGSPGTTGLYLVTMWDDDAEAAPKPWVQSFLGEDRIPYKEGFQRPKKVKTSKRLGDMVEAVLSVPV